LNQAANKKRKGKSIFNIADNQLTTIQRMKQSHPTSHRKEGIRKKNQKTTATTTTTARFQFGCWMNPGKFERQGSVLWI